MAQPLESLPALPRLYARVLRQAIRSRQRRRRRVDGGDSGCRTDAFRVSGVHLAGDKLAAYRHVCGFAAGDSVPATYPQVLAFPLQLMVLTGRGIPFPAIGAVHIANTIEQVEPLSPGAMIDLTAYATDQRPHRRGRQVSVVTVAHVAGQEVWRARSDYLHIERAGPGATRTDDPPAENAASPLDVHASWKLGADLGRRYAAVSGDRNPIHLYDLTARPFGFRRHIAHGMWTLARCLAQLEPDLSARARCDVTWRRPVPLPAQAEFAASRVDGGLDFRVGSRSSPDQYLRGRWRAE